MSSRLSRLVSSLRGSTSTPPRWQEERHQAPGPHGHEARSPGDARPTVSLHIGVDFGTSTTQVAYQVGEGEPRLVPLEEGRHLMPSYVALGADGELLFGSPARNMAQSVHSLKLRLRDNNPIAELGGRTSSEVAFAFIAEAVRRTATFLRGQRLLDGEVALLGISTSLGCTPMFSMDQRLLLRDVARSAGLNVWLPNLVEEPVAASYELVRSGVVDDGAILVIDIGGGTMDVAVVRSSLGREQVDLYATGGYELGGDKFTQIVVDRLAEAVRQHDPSWEPDRQDETLLWQRAEAAKIALSDASRTVVALGGVGDLVDDTVELEREWYERAISLLVLHTKARVQDVYRMARLLLDRGDELDPGPGTIYFEERSPGVLRRLTEVGLADDGLKHLNSVVLVGGASRTPRIVREFEEIFGDKLRDPEILGIDPVETVVLGLSRRVGPTGFSRMYPNWGVSAVFSSADVGNEIEVELYEPYAPAFTIRGGDTSHHRRSTRVPVGSQHVALAFRQVGGEGRRWDAVRIPHGATTVTLAIDLLGGVRLEDHAGRDLYGADDERGSKTRPKPPWWLAESDRLAEWLPPWKPRRRWHDDVPVWNLYQEM